MFSTVPKFRAINFVILRFLSEEALILNINRLEMLDRMCSFESLVCCRPFQFLHFCSNAFILLLPARTFGFTVSRLISPVQTYVTVLYEIEVTSIVNIVWLWQSQSCIHGHHTLVLLLSLLWIYSLRTFLLEINNNFIVFTVEHCLPRHGGPEARRSCG